MPTLLPEAVEWSPPRDNKRPPPTLQELLGPDNGYSLTAPMSPLTVSPNGVSSNENNTRLPEAHSDPRDLTCLRKPDTRWKESTIDPMTTTPSTHLSGTRPGSRDLPRLRRWTLPHTDARSHLTWAWSRRLHPMMTVEDAGP